MTRQNDIAARIKLILIFVFIAFGLVGFRMYYVQIELHEEYFAKAKSKYTSVAVKKGKRGEILDCDGNLLVGNVPCYDIEADPQIVGGRDKCLEIARYFSRKLGDVDGMRVYKRLMRKEYTRTLENGEKVKLPVQWALIASKVDFDISEEIRDEIKNLGFKGITFREKTKRFYPKDELLANILGFTNIDQDKVIAVIGIEKLFNDKISPTKSKAKYERSRDGIPFSVAEREKAHAKDGFNVYLTVKEPLQAILEEELENLCAEWKPKAAYAVMVDPWTGNVLALAQRPTFNPNDRKTMDPKSWRNRLLEDVFEPGSTMKPISISGAIDNGIVTPNTMFYCENGQWFYAGKRLKDSHAMKYKTVAEIIEESSNIGTAKIALMMGDNLLYKTLRNFGFGKRTGIGLGLESRGIFHPVKKWTKISITRIPMGQGIAVSPLQLVRAYCALANGGNLMDLRLVDRLENPDEGIVIKNPIKKPHKIYKNKTTHQKMIEMMKLVTQEGGTARKAAIDGYNVAGKTGTSQKVINGRYSHSKYFASFIGFVPAENPRFVLLVTADEPQKCHYGGTVAAPTFKKIAERTLRYMNVAPSYYEYAKNP